MKTFLTFLITTFQILIAVVPSALLVLSIPLNLAENNIYEFYFLTFIGMLCSVLVISHVLDNGFFTLIKKDADVTLVVKMTAEDWALEGWENGI